MSNNITRKYPRCIATISAGFEKGDFLVREEKGQRVCVQLFSVVDSQLTTNRAHMCTNLLQVL